MVGGRVAAFDVLRVMACVMVCVEHVVPYAGLEDREAGWYFVLMYVCEMGVPLFFMVSGALVLPIRGGGRGFLRRRFWAVGVPFLVWNVVYFVWSAWGFEGSLKPWVIKIPFFAVVNGTFWFLYAIWGLYLISPVLSAWLRVCNKRSVEVYLALWFVTCFFVYAAELTDFPFPTLRNPLYYLSGYVGLYMLGYYLRRYVDYGGCGFWLKWGALLLFGVVIPPMVERWVIGMRYLGEWDGGPWWVCFAVVLFTGVMKVASRRRPRRWLVCVSSLSLGVYLINYFVQQLLSGDAFTGGLTANEILLVHGVGTVVGSYGVVYVVSWLPGSKYVIGPVKRLGK